jgi:hypothetical protein
LNARSIFSSCGSIITTHIMAPCVATGTKTRRRQRTCGFPSCVTSYIAVAERSAASVLPFFPKTPPMAVSLRDVKTRALNGI